MRPQPRRTLWALGAAALALGACLTPPFAHADPTIPGRHLDARAKSDLRNLAVDEETYFTDKAHYGNFRQLAADGQRASVSAGVTLRIVHYDKTVGYCLAASTATKHSFRLDSQAGGVYRGTRCRKTTHGPSGGTRRGGRSGGKSATAVAGNLRNTAASEESYLADQGHYGSFAELSRAGDAPALSPHVTVTIVWYDAARSYCLRGSEHSRHRYYDSARGGLRPPGKHCSAKPQGSKPGGSRTG